MIIGGWDERETRDQILVYDPRTNLCNFSGIQLPKPIECHSVVKVGNQIFVLGGFDSFGVTDSIMRIDLENRSAVMLETKLALARENHTS